MVTNLILEAGGSIEGEMVDVVVPAAEDRTAKRPPVSLAVGEVQRLLGATEDGQGVSAGAVEGVLSALGCGMAAEGEGEYRVTLPSWRLDLEREIDLVEEVARVYGYNRFANTLPVFAGTVVELPHATTATTVRELMLASGFNEAVTSTFCAETDAELFAPQPGTVVAMGNPLNAEAGMLRPSLGPGMVTAAETNTNRNMGDVRLFEMGTVFSGTTDRVDERLALGWLATGRVAQSGPHQAPRNFDFYDAKGLVEAVAEKFQFRSMYFDALMLPAWLHPGRSARCAVDGMTVANFGLLHPAEAQRRKLKQDVWVGEIYLERLFTLALKQPRVQELSRFQAVERDFSFLLPDAVRWEQIAEQIEALGIPELQRFAPREVLREGVAGAGAGEYALLLSVVFQAADRTLKDEEVQGWWQRVVDALSGLGGRLRG